MCSGFLPARNRKNKLTKDTFFAGIRLKFISPLKDQTVKEGETAFFNFELSHENIPVTWYRNDKKLHTSRTVLISEEGKTHKLEIRDVTLDDISQIKAEVKDLHTSANLKVLGMIYVTWQSELLLVIFWHKYYILQHHIGLLRFTELYLHILFQSSTTFSFRLSFFFCNA